jgi:hypothetical protein
MDANPSIIYKHKVYKYECKVIDVDGGVILLELTVPYGQFKIGTKNSCSKSVFVKHFLVKRNIPWL